MGIKVLQEQIAPLLPAAPVIIEAGAHIGRDTVKMSHFWPNSLIHAFEPVPELFEQLQIATSGLQNVHCYSYALANHTGTALMHVSSGRSTATSSLLEPLEYSQEFPETTFHQQVVPTITLDDWAQKVAISHVDFMWLDMQGGELAALKAGISLLKTVKIIYIEITFTQRYKHNPLFAEVNKWLMEQGFKCTFTTLIKPTFGNALFVRKQ